MKTKSFFFKKTLSTLFLIAVVLILSTTSCKKEMQTEPVSSSSGETTSGNDMDFRSTILQMVYGITSDKLNDPASVDMYNALMENASEAQLSQLEEIVETYKHELQAAASNGVIGLKSAGSETILSAGINGDGFGSGIAKSGNTLFVGAASNSKVYVYQNDVLVQTLSGGVNFGYQVASSANWLAVMAGDNPYGGQVVLFKKQGNSWVEHSTIEPGFQFFAAATGSDIAMHGNTLAILGRTLSVSGIQVYKLTGDTWSLETTLQENDTFWWDMDIHGNTIVANGGTNAGLGILFNPHVYIYEVSGLTTVPFPQPGNVLARYVAIHNSTIVANVAFNSTKSYVITPSSGTWAISGELVNPNQGSQGSSQGRRLAIEGSKVVVTYPTTKNFSSEGNDANDAAFVFEQSGGAWNLTETLTPSTGGLNIQYGYRALVKGNQVILGALNYDANTPGAVFIYE